MDFFQTAFKIEVIISVTSVVYPCSRIAQYIV